MEEISPKICFMGELLCNIIILSKVFRFGSENYQFAVNLPLKSLTRKSIQIQMYIKKPKSFQQSIKYLFTAENHINLKIFRNVTYRF